MKDETNQVGGDEGCAKTRTPPKLKLERANLKDSRHVAPQRSPAAPIASLCSSKRATPRKPGYNQQRSSSKDYHHTQATAKPAGDDLEAKGQSETEKHSKRSPKHQDLSAKPHNHGEGVAMNATRNYCGFG